MKRSTVYPKKYAHGFCFTVLCCGYTFTDFPISIRLTSLALLQSNDCPSASKATLMNIDKYFMWIHYERLHNHNKTKHNKTMCIFLGIYCMYPYLIFLNDMTGIPSQYHVEGHEVFHPLTVHNLWKYPASVTPCRSDQTIISVQEFFCLKASTFKYF